jgi:threonine dehydrogenase-like Zn-dependent dehydrogenase
MQALVCENSLPKQAITKLLGTLSPRAFVGPLAPIRMREIPDPSFPGPDWLVIRTTLCGLCGSDYKQVFLNGRPNNPMTALISFPQVLGHEVVGTVEAVGPAVRHRRVGERVVLNPWLSCAPRGIDPVCASCARGDLSLCENFARGRLAPGIHTGNSATATGGFAPLVPAHESMCFPIPDGVDDSAAVLADPFSVAFHSVVQSPPPEEGWALVYGCGTLGLLTIAILRMMAPRLRVVAVARYPHQARLARQFGAEADVEHRPTSRVIEEVARLTGTELLKPWYGQPMLNRGVDIVYDTVSSAETLEVGVRVTRPRARIVVTGVEIPRRFEWTPLYFKEIALVGSNAFAIEEYQGQRRHAMEWYLDFVARGLIDVTPILTHRFALHDYREAFLACWDQGASGAVKVVFNF